ncbi:NAD-dependent protein deacylase [Allofustis seminis]|uniref:NAD-dependent protein deacylase n=1 Tax=Allofustis seminis TaxID=166939 RepID=UPI0003616C03|nr:NAD-dependent protein deacylase [Allofustis seminis]
MNKIEQFAQQLKDSQRIVFFGGAGVSTESGIPDFRSAKGLYREDSPYEVPVEAIISHSFYEAHPKEFFDYYFEHLVFEEAQPNIVHKKLAELERFRKVTVVTQNIDGLHSQAGSSDVQELHGTIFDNHCTQCGAYVPLKELKKDDNKIPRCPHCHGIVKPDVTLYEEQLPTQPLMQSIEAIAKADMLIVGGTSLVVYPAAGLIRYFHGKYFTLINKTPLGQTYGANLIFEDKLSNVFKQLPAFEQLFKK